MSEQNLDSRDVGDAPADTARHLDPTQMRQLAEAKAAAMAAAMATAMAVQELESPSPEQIRQIMHELRVHQIQLEMQNDELRRSETELDAVRARYFDLYDLAPVGYCTVSEAGLILEGNLTAAKLLGATRSELVGSRSSISFSERTRTSTTTTAGNCGKLASCKRANCGCCPGTDRRSGCKSRRSSRRITARMRRAVSC
jgi:PAS domain-containing protein